MAMNKAATYDELGLSSIFTGSFSFIVLRTNTANGWNHIAKNACENQRRIKTSFILKYFVATVKLSPRQKLQTGAAFLHILFF